MCSLDIYSVLTNNKVKYSQEAACGWAGSWYRLQRAFLMLTCVVAPFHPAILARQCQTHPATAVTQH